MSESRRGIINPIQSRVRSPGWPRRWSTTRWPLLRRVLMRIRCGIIDAATGDLGTPGVVKAHQCRVCWATRRIERYAEFKQQITISFLLVGAIVVPFVLCRPHETQVHSVNFPSRLWIVQIWVWIQLFRVWNRPHLVWNYKVLRHENTIKR